MKRSVLKVRDLNKAFGGKKVIDELSFELREGEVVGLIGPNGAGKSTLLNLLLNILKKDSGEVFFQGIDVTKMKTNKITRMGVARSFQDSKPLPQISVRDNLDIAFRYKNRISLKNALFGRKSLMEEEADNLKVIKGLLEEVGIGEKINVQAKDVSYGQGKLLEMLKVLVSGAELVFLDEPFSGLFPEMIKLVSEQIRKLVKEGKTVVLIEHNMKLIKEICDRVMVLDAGRLIADGSFEEVTKNELVIESYLGK